MRTLVSLLSICVLVALVAACGTDDPASSANNSSEVDAGVDATGEDADDGGGSDATDGGGDEDATDGGGEDADTGEGGDDADGGDEPDGGDADGGDEPPTPCTSKDDCPIGEVCYIDRSGAGVEMYCRAENDGGGGLGNICTADVGCAANLCHDGRFRDVCSIPCDDDADCSAEGYECGTASVDDGAGGSVDLSVCVAEDPPACDSNDDCGAGTTCAIVPNADEDALESVCVPTAGGKATGTECTDDAECASLVCLADHCAAPCELSDQCASGQRCEANTILKESLSGAFNVCETLPDERCDDTGTCSDGVRVCSEIRSVSNGEREGYCQFPDSNAPASLGDHCTQTSDCRERICLSGNSDECSVMCAEDSQCAAGQICTTYPVGNSDLGFCNSGCSDNSDCAGLEFTNSNGDLVEHACRINENVREDQVDQICIRKNIVNTNDPDEGLLGDDCEAAAGGIGSNSLCQSGACLSIDSPIGGSCNSDSDCSDPGNTMVCRIPKGGTTKECHTRIFRCSRLCDDNGDCSGGIDDNQLTVCDSDVQIQLSSGTVETVSMCAQPDP